MRERGSLLFSLIFLFMLGLLALPAGLAEWELRHRHVHEPVHYYMRGRMNTDTLCRTDTMLVRYGEHRPVPEVLEEIVWHQMGQTEPIVEKPF